MDTGAEQTQKYCSAEKISVFTAVWQRDATDQKKESHQVIDKQFIRLCIQSCIKQVQQTRLKIKKIKGCKHFVNMCFSGRLRRKSDQPVTAVVRAGTLKNHKLHSIWCVCSEDCNLKLHLNILTSICRKTAQCCLFCCFCEPPHNLFGNKAAWRC